MMNKKLAYILMAVTTCRRIKPNLMMLTGFIYYRKIVYDCRKVQHSLIEQVLSFI